MSEVPLHICLPREEISPSGNHHLQKIGGEPHGVMTRVAGHAQAMRVVHVAKGICCLLRPGTQPSPLYYIIVPATPSRTSWGGGYMYLTLAVLDVPNSCGTTCTRGSRAL